MSIIDFSDVTFTYAKGARPAIANIDLEVKQGEVLMITGPAGSGKTTLCRTLNGLIPNFFEGDLRGKLMINGQDTEGFSIAQLSHSVALLFQDPASQLISPTVYDELAFGPENYGIPREEILVRVENILNRLGLEKYREKNPHSLSGGEQQATALGAILAMKPLIYVLDEPTSNLDPIGSQQVLRWISELAKDGEATVVIVEHKMEEMLPLADRVVVMNHGKVVWNDTPEKVLEHVEVMGDLGLKPPQVSLLASRLKKEGLLPHDTPIPITCEAFLEILSGVAGKRDTSAPRKRQEAGEASHNRQRIIECKDLRHVYPRGAEALRGINLGLYSAEFVALLGQNGSGKTTLVKHFNALLKPTSGKVVVYGVDTSATDTVELSRKVGFCFQDPDLQICCRTVKEELEFGPKNLGIPQETIDRRVGEAVRRFDLLPFLDQNPFSLSKGERQKLSVASVLVTEPEVLIVDEPTTGQDFGGSMEMLNFLTRINQQGKTVVVITHDMDIAARAERTIVLKDGKILLDGPTAWVFSQSAVLAETHLRPPQVTRLSQMLASYGVPEGLLNVDEAYEEIKKIPRM